MAHQKEGAFEYPQKLKTSYEKKRDALLIEESFQTNNESAFEKNDELGQSHGYSSQGRLNRRSSLPKDLPAYNSRLQNVYSVESVLQDSFRKEKLLTESRAVEKIG